MPTTTSPPPVRAWLQISVAILLAMSGVIFACAEWSPLAAATVPVALVGLLFVDRQRFLRVNSTAANFLAMLAVFASGYEFFGNAAASRLLAFGHLLVYLAWILLLQDKQTKEFWWLCALSVLQVATSAVLTNSPWLGLALILYVTFALWTLSLFSVYRAAIRAVGVEETAQTIGNTDRQQLSHSRNAVRLESAARWMTSRFVGGVAVNVVLSMMLGLAIFILTPRVWVGSPEASGEQTMPAVRAISGFSEEVNLGGMGEILASPDRVMEVRYFDNETDRPVTQEQFLDRVGAEAPLYRGAVLETYHDGRWSSLGSRYARPAEWGILNSRDKFFRVDFRLFPTTTTAVFSPPGTLTCLPSKRYDHIDHETLRDTFHRAPAGNQWTAEAFEYSAFAVAARHVPSSRASDRHSEYVRRMLELPPGLEPVRTLAERIIRTSDDEEDLTPDETVRRLVAHLRDSGEYAYTTDVSIDDPTIDPVVDFLVNRKEGHCEYFASALTLLLRAANLSARYVSGYKGGTFNKKAQRYEVRQLHAHAWVEAYLDDEWVVLDPTPAARDESVAANAAESHFWTDLLAQMRLLWDSAMLLSASQQKQMLVRPFQDSASTFVHTFTDFTQLYTEGIYGVEGSRGSTGSVLWPIIGSLLALGVLLTGAYGVFTVFAAGGGRFNRLLKKSAQAAGISVPFYERFRAILARHGIKREAAQTHREFATSLHARWLGNGSAAMGDDFPDLLTMAFYRTRFGNHPLPPGDLRHIEASLDRLEQSLSNGDSRNGDHRR